MRPVIGFFIFDGFTIDLAFCLKIWKNMQKVYKSVYNAEICLAPRRLDFGSGAGPRMRLPLAFTNYGLLKKLDFPPKTRGKEASEEKKEEERKGKEPGGKERREATPNSLYTPPPPDRPPLAEITGRKDNSNLIKNIDKEIGKEMRKLGIKEENLQEGTWAIPDSYKKLYNIQVGFLEMKKAATKANAKRMAKDLYNLFGDDELFDDLLRVENGDDTRILCYDTAFYIKSQA